MKKRSIRQRDLPEWFDLSNYESAKELTLSGWLTNLIVRSLAKDESDKLHFTDFLLKKIVQDPLLRSVVDRPSGPAIETPEDTSRTPKQRNPLQTATIESTPAWWGALRYAEMHQSESPMVKRIAKAALGLDGTKSSEEEFDEFIAKDEPYDLFMKKPGINNDGYYELLVQIRAPDDQIMADFSTWLREARSVFEEPAPSKCFTQSDTEKWVTFMVLPYLDLEIWAENEDARIPYALMGKVLFPNAYDYDPTERVRRTTKPMAYRLIRMSVLRAFETQLEG